MIAAQYPLDTKPGAPEQTHVLNWALSGDHSCGNFRRSHRVQVAFQQGDGGAGKSYVAKRAIAEVHVAGGVALVAAPTAKAATAFKDGHTLHELAGIPIDTDADGNVIIRTKREGGRLTEQRLELLRAADLIVVDEAPSLHKRVIEAFIYLLRTHGCHTRVLRMGDFQQIPPIVRENAREFVFAASLRSSHIYANATVFTLTKQYRAAEDPEYADMLCRFGNGTLPPIAKHPDNDEDQGVRMVKMPLVTELFHEGDSEYETAAIEWLYGVDDRGCLKVDVGTKAILCATNKLRDKWNDLVSRRRAAYVDREREQTYEAFHKADIDSGADETDEM